MSEELDANARALLEAVLTGARAADDAEVAQLARASVPFRVRLEELRAAAELLERTAAAERETRRAAATLTHAPGEDTLGRGLARERGQRRGRRVAWLALAAAGVALCLFLLRDRGRNERPEPVWLGGETVRLLHPRGTVESFAPIEWQGRLSPGGEYRITITAATDATASEDVLLEHRTADTRWTPSAEQLERLPTRVRIEVAVFLDGVLQAADSGISQR